MNTRYGCLKYNLFCQKVKSKPSNHSLYVEHLSILKKDNKYIISNISLSCSSSVSSLDDGPDLLTIVGDLNLSGYNLSDSGLCTIGLNKSVFLLRREKPEPSTISATLSSWETLIPPTSNISHSSSSRCLINLRQMPLKSCGFP